MDRENFRVDSWTYLRTAVVLLLFVAATLLGAWLGRTLKSAWPTLADLGPVWWVVMALCFMLGATLFLLTLRTTARFVNCGSQHFAEFMQAAGPALVLFLLVGSTASAGSKNEPASAPIGVHFGTPAAAHDSILLPFFPIEGKSNRCDPAQTEFGRAEELSGGMEATLGYLMKALAACASKENPVRVDVRGFASSSDFEGCERSVSERLNWRLAERRRLAIIHAARAYPAVRIEPSPNRDRWRGPADMRNHMQFLDTDSGGSYNGDKGALTRRVEVVILDKGDCEPR